jgi:hypothetical protein
LLKQAIQAKEEARAAAERQDAKAAMRAAKASQKAASRLKELAESGKPGSTNAQQVLGEAQAAARSARDCAELAEEERQLRAKLASLKVRADRRTRGVILSHALPPAASAADKAAQEGTNSLNLIERQLAKQAWNLVTLLTERAPLTNGCPDWAGAATDLRQWSTNPPLEFSAFLLVAFLFAGQTDLALAEVESVDLGRPAATNALPLCQVGRGLVFVFEGWDRLAGREAEKLELLPPDEKGLVKGNQVVAVFHGFLAYDALTQRDLKRMDAEIARSLKAWPDNPLAVFLTGEQLAANGEWVKAADSLEAQVAGTEDEWLARRLAQRARDLRDDKGSSKALVFDARFLLEVAAHTTARGAKKSGAAKRLDQLIAEAKTFGDRLTERRHGENQK